MTNKEIIKKFIKKFCNNHQKPVRFLRSIFWDEQDGAEKIIEFLEQALEQKDKEKLEIENKSISIGINAFNQPTDSEIGKMIKDMLDTRTIREPYWEGSTLTEDYLYLKIHQS